jgi:GNAT superfamily N-acetyltransferase
MALGQAGYRIECVDTPDDQDYTVVGKGLQAYNIQHAGESGHRPLCLFLHAPGGEVVGGLAGSTYWDWFYVDLFWLREDVRGQGHGHRLIELAENEARERGARAVYLDTFSFQAPDFYRDHGYEVFGELTDFPRGHRRYFFKKAL